MSTLTLDLARRCLDAAESAAREQDVALTFAVVDAAGHLLALHRMDGAPWITPEVAIGKAWTAAAYGVPSGAQGEKMRDLPVFSTAVTVVTGGRFTPQIGGLPIVVDGTVVGAMGASGASGAEDEAAVRAGLEAAGVQ
jgi:glc operon protein GlcG